MHVWLGYAKHQWKYNEDDARDTFKTLKNQLPGESNAHLFHTWATLEAGSGNMSKALSILQKGMKERAQPSSLLDQLRMELQSGTLNLTQEDMHHFLATSATITTARAPCSAVTNKTAAMSGHTAHTVPYSAGPSPSSAQLPPPAPAASVTAAASWQPGSSNLGPVQPQACSHPIANSALVATLTYPIRERHLLQITSADPGAHSVGTTFKTPHPTNNNVPRAFGDSGLTLSTNYTTTTSRAISTEGESGLSSAERWRKPRPSDPGDEVTLLSGGGALLASRSTVSGATRSTFSGGASLASEEDTIHCSNRTRIHKGDDTACTSDSLAGGSDDNTLKSLQARLAVLNSGAAVQLTTEDHKAEDVDSNLDLKDGSQHGRPSSSNLVSAAAGGLKRFGFKSKALRITNGSGSGGGGLKAAIPIVSHAAAGEGSCLEAEAASLGRGHAPTGSLVPQTAGYKGDHGLPVENGSAGDDATDRREEEPQRGPCREQSLAAQCLKPQSLQSVATRADPVLDEDSRAVSSAVHCSASAGTAVLAVELNFAAAAADDDVIFQGPEDEDSNEAKVATQKSKKRCRALSQMGRTKCGVEPASPPVASLMPGAVFRRGQGGHETLYEAGVDAVAVVGSPSSAPAAKRRSPLEAPAGEAPASLKAVPCHQKQALGVEAAMRIGVVTDRQSAAAAEGGEGAAAMRIGAVTDREGAAACSDHALSVQARACPLTAEVDEAGRTVGAPPNFAHRDVDVLRVRQEIHTSGGRDSDHDVDVLRVRQRIHSSSECSNLDHGGDENQDPRFIKPAGLLRGTSGGHLSSITMDRETPLGPHNSSKHDDQEDELQCEVAKGDLSVKVVKAEKAVVSSVPVRPTVILAKQQHQSHLPSLRGVAQTPTSALQDPLLHQGPLPDPSLHQGTLDVVKGDRQGASAVDSGSFLAVNRALSDHDLDAAGRLREGKIFKSNQDVHRIKVPLPTPPPNQDVQRKVPLPTPPPKHHSSFIQSKNTAALAAAAASSSANAAAPSSAERGLPPERLAEPQRQAMEDNQWVYVHGIRYQKLDCVGRGGSSKVFKVLACNRQIYALKRVRLANKDPEAIQGFIEEITLLKQLRNTPNIIQLVNAQVFRDQGLIYMVLEYGDIDLARLLHNHEESKRAALMREAATSAGEGDDDRVAESASSSAAARGVIKNKAETGEDAGIPSPDQGRIDENFVRLYWQQMLQAVCGIHELKIVHSDLKPANFLLVQGQLKLIDFGIAKSIQGDTTSISRESQVGTLNYMSPEAIQGGSSNPLGGPAQRVGRPSDVWSLGCILYQMIYGRTPFADLPFIPKMSAICNPQHQITFGPCSNPAAIDVLKRCLDRDATTRATIQELLNHVFLHPEKAAAPPPAMPALPTGSSSSNSMGFTEEQLKSIVSQVAAITGGATLGTSGTLLDIESLTKQVLQKMTVEAAAATTSARSGAGARHELTASGHEGAPGASAISPEEASGPSIVMQPISKLDCQEASAFGSIMPSSNKATLQTSRPPAPPPAPPGLPPPPPSIHTLAATGAKQFQRRAGGSEALEQHLGSRVPLPGHTGTTALTSTSVKAADNSGNMQQQEGHAVASGSVASTRPTGASRKVAAALPSVADIATAAADAAVRRANDKAAGKAPPTAVQPKHLPAEKTSVQPAATGGKGDRSFPLAGAELQAAILQRRSQLRSVPLAPFK
ncbi:hypothetical protein CEUSTIGMA_g8670.t1 [Chlamydomonas eustigma]|uniref:Protein kinase domain-containing protein n=1 Tax=Chlamydomonas eustigma TaxID=1157962 RepID=A0A250XDS8_9CHLO|nr:hypothetical protein CEUSTIGMA_g8670.t1 [Chlamydomonas eustigma]|eukprot:GAX81238.1 hypothetical protein CEUSTIGMA_g8670.t1 [Chlamydomonas eustigma]